MSIIKAYNYAKKNGLISQGSNWYNEANKYASELSLKYHLTLVKSAAIIAALSPGVSWELNKKDAEVLAQAYEVNEHNDVFRYHNFSTYGKNVLKAIEILNSTRDPLTFFERKNSGFKTRAFYLNILDPFNDNEVTIDRHAISIRDGLNKSYKVQLTRKKYQSYAEAYISAAKKLKMIPSELQAVTWVAYKHAQDNNVKIFK